MYRKITRRGATGIFAGALALAIAAVPFQQAMAQVDFSGKRLRIIVPFNDDAEPINSVPISKTSKLEDTIASHSWLRPITASLHPKD